MFRFRLEDQGSLSENLEVSQGKGLLKEEETARAEARRTKRHLGSRATVGDETC